MIRRNPWMALLWVIGCVLVLGTAGMQTWTAWFYFQTDLAVVGDPVLTTLAQIAGALALPAARENKPRLVPKARSLGITAPEGRRSTTSAQKARTDSDQGLNGFTTAS